MHELEHQASELEKSKSESFAEQKKIIAVQNQQIELQTKEICDLQAKIAAMNKDCDYEKSIIKTLQDSLDHLTSEIKQLKQNNESLLLTAKSTNENLPDLRSSFSSNFDDMGSSRRLPSERKSVNSAIYLDNIHHRENLDGLLHEMTSEENKKLKTKIDLLEEHLKDLRLEFRSQKKNSGIQIQNLQKEFMDSLHKNEDLINNLTRINF